MKNSFRCWRKAGILPGPMQSHLVKQFGSVQTKKEHDAAIDELCSMMKSVSAKAVDVDCNGEAIALKRINLDQSEEE